MFDILLESLHFGMKIHMWIAKWSLDTQIMLLEGFARVYIVSSYFLDNPRTSVFYAFPLSDLKELKKVRNLIF